MSKFIITIEEHICKDFVIDAIDVEEAMRLAEKKYYDGELVLDGDSEVHTKLMTAYDSSNDKHTEWTEF